MFDKGKMQVSPARRKRGNGRMELSVCCWDGYRVRRGCSVWGYSVCLSDSFLLLARAVINPFSITPLQPAFEKATLATSVGGMSPVIESYSGVHIIFRYA